MKTLKQWYTELFPGITKAESRKTGDKDLIRWLDHTDLKLKKRHDYKIKRLKLL